MVDWNNSRPQFFKEVIEDLSLEELQAVKEYQGLYMNVFELDLLSQSPLITIGNHLRNHWLMDSVELEDLVIEIAENKKELQKFESYRNFFAAPHGIASERTLLQLLNNDYKFVFSGKTFLQEGPLNVYPRVDLNIGITNIYQFFGAILIGKIRAWYYSMPYKKRGPYSRN